MTILAKLKKSMREKYALSLRTSNPEDESYLGVVVRLTPEFVAVRVFHDFVADGIVVFALPVIVDAVDDGNIRCANRVLHHNGQIEKIRAPKWLDKCESLFDVCQVLKKREIWPAVEVMEGQDTWFLIGPLESVEPEGIVIRHYLADGKWDDSVPVALPFVTRIEFDSSYVKHFGNYMKSKSSSRRTR
jgi:hypothetical protein